MYEQLDNYIGELISYKSICEETGIKYQKGNGKDSQLKDIQRYYQLEKVKTKFRVIEKYEAPLEKEDGRSETSAENGVKYADDIETIMLYALQNKKEFVCTISQALLLCNLVNKNYAVGRRDIPLTSKLLELDIKNVYMFYDNTSRRLKDTFERALNRMRGKALLSYTKPMRVAYNDIQIELNELGEPKLDKHNRISYSVNEIHRDATKEEIDVVLDAEANTLEYMGCVDKKQVFLSHRWNEFRDKVTEEINSRLNIKYYYEAYDIVVNTKHIDRTIKKYEVMGSESILNYNILDSLISSLDKADLKVDMEGNRKYSDKFISDTKVMVETVINSECRYDLPNEMKKYKGGLKNKPVETDGLPF